MVSEMSRGLFHGVIAVSGAITSEIPLDKNNIPEAQELAKNLGCPTDVDLIYDCVMTVRIYLRV